MTRIMRRGVLGAALAAPFVRGAAAQERFPNKPITILVPFTPGGATDVQMRSFAEAATIPVAGRLAKSAPAQNDWSPAPVMITAQMSGLRSASSSASPTPTVTARFTALRASGRLRVTIITRSRRSTRTASLMR